MPITPRRLLQPLALAVLTAALWACSGEKPLNTTEVAARSIYSAAVSADARFALIGSEYHGGSLWRLQDRERIYDWNHRQGEYTAFTAAGFSPDGAWALTTDSRTLVLWNVETGTAERFWSGTAEVLAVALGNKGNLALLGLSDRTAALHAVKRGGIVRSFQHAERVTSVALSDDGKLALTGSDDHSAIVWDTESGKALHSVVHSDPVQLVALSRDGRRALSAARYDSITIWDTRTGATLWQLPIKTEWLRRGTTIVSAAFSDDGAFLLSGGHDGRVQLWSVDQQQLVYEWHLPRRKIYQPLIPSVLGVGFGAEGNRFYAVSSDGFVHQLGY